MPIVSTIHLTLRTGQNVREGGGGGGVGGAFENVVVRKHMTQPFYLSQN